MLFLKKREKPENPLFDATLVLNYSSHKSEYYAKQLVRKIKDVLPDLHINIALKTVKVKQLFSRASKPEKVAKFDTPESVYEFVCPCSENYIGETKRPLKTRIRDFF